jgi:hypothetical protein
VVFFPNGLDEWRVSGNPIQPEAPSIRVKCKKRIPRRDYRICAISIRLRISDSKTQFEDGMNQNQRIATTF